MPVGGEKVAETKTSTSALLAADSPVLKTPMGLS
jgi:hypothetical protein